MGKLKRFLLRYDPPGIGLEIESEEGSVNVRHIDLPAGTEVASSKEINTVVDRLIAEEDLLTKRRHRPALLQLLGRLYQVEVDPTDDEGTESVPSPSQGAAKEGFQEGQQVVLVGLAGKQQAHNGEMGTLTKVKKDKFEVALNMAGRDADPVKVKGVEHIVALAPKGTPLSVGAHVAIRGLRNHVELNGCIGRVVECHEESHRYEVRATESGQLFRVKQENLVPIEMAGAGGAIAASFKENREPNTNTTPRKKDNAGSGGAAGAAPGDQAAAASVAGAGDGEEIFEPGSQVQLVGLKTAMCYNGQTAEVLSVDRVRCRYEIRLADGSVKTIRAENVRLAMKASPRPRRKEGTAAGAAQSGKMR
uniref:Uncharacterized protein n=1 Tax=Alexandrium monilatum TaxID=311494 RepID=A0A7S4RCU1_9DINO